MQVFSVFRAQIEHFDMSKLNNLKFNVQNQVAALKSKTSTILFHLVVLVNALLLQLTLKNCIGIILSYGRGCDADIASYLYRFCNL